MRSSGAGRGRRSVGTALAALVVAATCVVGATAAGQVGPTYKKLGGWGKLGTANGQFGGNAFGIAVSKSGDVFVADADNRRVQVFSAAGAFKRAFTFAADEVPQDVAAGLDGSAWAAILQAGEARGLGGSDALSTGLQEATGVAVDAEGNVHVAASGDNVHKLVRFDKGSGYAVGKTIGGLSDPADVEVSPDGSVYVVDGLTVKRFVDGRLAKVIRGGASKPLGIGVDLDCNLWMTNISQRNVTRVSPSGKVLGIAATPDLIAQDVAVGPKGDLYAYDSGTHSIVRLAEDRSKPAAAIVGGTVALRGGVARVKYTLSGVACPAQVAATASLSGAVHGKAAVKVPAGRPTVLSIPARGASGKAQFKIVLKTNGRPTTQVAPVDVTVR